MNQSTKNYKRFAVCFMWSLCVACVISALLGILLYIYDPFMLFHKPYFRAMTYHSDKRISAKGIIDYGEFDGVFMGSSIFENLSPKEADEKLGGKWVNLSISALSVSERNVMLKSLFKHKKAKRIIYSIEGWELVRLDDKKADLLRDKNDRPKRIHTDYLQLYDKNNYLKKFSFYVNKRFINCALSYSKKPECVGEKELPLFGGWYISNKNKFGGFNKWNDGTKKYIAKQLLQAQEIQNASLEIKKIKDKIQKNVFLFVRENPNVKFYFVVPTHSRLSYRLPKIAWAEQIIPAQQYFKYHKIMLKWFVNEVAKYQNAKIYGFDDLDYAEDLANYCDDIHYNIDMNSMQLDAIANGTHILTPQNIDKYLTTMESKIKNYDIAPLIAEIKAWEANHKR